jgi:hypothetical protein
LHIINFFIILDISAENLNSVAEASGNKIPSYYGKLFMVLDNGEKTV